MSNKRTYINIINDFWELDAREKFSNSVTRLFFYLLNRINRNRWEPVFISDRELAEVNEISRNQVKPYREKLKALGLIDFDKKGAGRQAGTIYRTAPERAINGTAESQLTKTNGTPRSQLNKETAPERAINGTAESQLTPPTPINDNNKTSLRPSTTTEDMRASAHTHAGIVAAVEVEAVEVFEIKKAVEQKEEGIEGAAALLLEKKRKAASQGAEVLKAFFDETNRATLETLCMQNGLDFRQLRAIGERIVSDWIQDGRTHDDYNGRFDISDALKHLRMTIPKKAAAEARQQAAPKTRDQKRQELMAASYAGLQRVINGDLPAQPEGPAPF